MDAFKAFMYDWGMYIMLVACIVYCYTSHRVAKKLINERDEIAEKLKNQYGIELMEVMK